MKVRCERRADIHDAFVQLGCAPITFDAITRFCQGALSVSQYYWPVHLLHWSWFGSRTKHALERLARHSHWKILPVDDVERSKLFVRVEKQIEFAKQLRFGYHMSASKGNRRSG